MLHGFILVSLLMLQPAPAAMQAVTSVTFEAHAAGEAVATIAAVCPACDWGARGREAVALTLELDGQYSQHLLLTTHGSAPYRVTLGPVGEGEHRLVLAYDKSLSAPAAGSFAVANVSVRVVTAEEPAYEKLAFAPILHERPDTTARFSDTPLLMSVESEITPAGRRFRYSVVFSNEDGGTPTDRLMATWGRATDIELVYDVAMDARGNILKEEIQGPDHKLLPFRGSKIGSHPLLWIVTDNNMAGDKGETRTRYAPAPIPFDSASRSREALMDSNPWTYAIMAGELSREGKIDDGARAGSGAIPDPRRYAYIEACADLSDATAIAFDIGVEQNAGVEWFSTDRNLPQFRIARSGCFRAAAPIPDGVRLSAGPELRLRARAYRKIADPDTPPPQGPVSAIIRRVNGIFILGDEYRPIRSVMKWTGTLTVGSDEAVELKVKS